MFLYYELCEKIWGGSPATETIETGVESEEVNCLVDREEEMLSDENEDEESQSDKGDSSSQFGDRSSSSSSHPSEDEDIQRGRKRREELSATLSAYKLKKMKKGAPTDSRMINLAEKELSLKKSMMEQFEIMNRDHKETMNMLTTNLKSLSDTMTSTFALLQQSMLRPPHLDQYPPVPLSYHSPHHYPPTPSARRPNTRRSTSRDQYCIDDQN